MSDLVCIAIERSGMVSFGNTMTLLQTRVVSFLATRLLCTRAESPGHIP